MFWRRNKRPKDSLRDSFLETVTPLWNIQPSELKLVENGFEWLPGSHLVRVFVHEDARKLVEPPPLRISISTAYRRCVPVRDRKFVELAGYSANLSCPTYSWVYPPVELEDILGGHPTDLELFASVYVDESTSGWLPRFFARMSIMQPVNAEIQSEMDGVIFGGAQPAFSSGSKVPVTNAILGVARDVLVPEGKKPNHWIGSDEFEVFVDVVAGQDNCLAYATKEGMVLATPFGEEKASIYFWTHQHHQLGNGLLIGTKIPMGQVKNDVFDLAAALNFLESRFWTDIPQLGCWHPHSEEKSLAHTVFVPNALFMPNLVGYLAHWALQRVEWLQRTRFPELPKLTIDEILENESKGS